VRNGLFPSIPMFPFYYAVLSVSIIKKVYKSFFTESEWGRIFETPNLRSPLTFPAGFQYQMMYSSSFLVVFPVPSIVNEEEEVKN
jgi:hypothetical protein